jgi:hypothetical protein
MTFVERVAKALVLNTVSFCGGTKWNNNNNNNCVLAYLFLGADYMVT